MSFWLACGCLPSCLPACVSSQHRAGLGTGAAGKGCVCRIACTFNCVPKSEACFLIGFFNSHHLRLFMPFFCSPPCYDNQELTVKVVTGLLRNSHGPSKQMLPVSLQSSALLSPSRCPLTLLKVDHFLIYRAAVTNGTAISFIRVNVPQCP